MTAFAKTVQIIHALTSRLQAIACKQLMTAFAKTVQIIHALTSRLQVIDDCFCKNRTNYTYFNDSPRT